MAQRSNSSDGAEAYPFDPSVRAEHEHDLERLRGFADRKLAAYLFDLYQLAATNSALSRNTAKPTATSMDCIRALARRALTGRLGAEAEELADALLLDPTGRERSDEASLRTFARAYRDLKGR